MKIAVLVIGLIFMGGQELYGQLRVQALGDGTLAVVDDKTYAFTNPAYLSVLSQSTTFFVVGRQGGEQTSEQRVEYPFDTGVVVSGPRPADPDQRTDRTAQSDLYWTWGGLLNWESRYLHGSRIGFGLMVWQRLPDFNQTSRVFTPGRWIRGTGGQSYTFDADFWQDSQTHVDRNGSSVAAHVGAGIAWKAARAGFAGTFTTRNSDSRNEVRFINADDFTLNFNETEAMDAAWRLQAFRMGWVYRIRTNTAVEGFVVVEKDRKRQTIASASDGVPGASTAQEHLEQRRTVVIRSVQQLDPGTRLIQQLGLGWGDGDVRRPNGNRAPDQRIEERNDLEIRAGLGFSTQLHRQTFLVGEVQGLWNDETRTIFETSGIKAADVRVDTTEFRVNFGIEQQVRKMWALRIGMISRHFWFRSERSQFDPTTTVLLLLDKVQRRTRQIRFTAGLGYQYRSFFEAHYAFKTRGTLVDDSHAVEVILRF